MTAIRPGDSGSWVADPLTGTVYGHIIATSSDMAFLVPLKSILNEIGDANKKTGIGVALASLPSPFESLAECSRALFAAGYLEKAMEFARKAVSHAVLQQSPEDIIAQDLMSCRAKHTQSDVEGTMAEVIMRTRVDANSGKMVWRSEDVWTLHARPAIHLEIISDICVTLGLETTTWDNSFHPGQAVIAQTMYPDKKLSFKCLIHLWTRRTVCIPHLNNIRLGPF